MNKVALEYDGETGSLHWSNSMEIVLVDFPTASVKERVEKYISTSRTFKIPQSPKIDDYLDFSARPDESDLFMRLGLCTLYARTGVFVIWE